MLGKHPPYRNNFNLLRWLLASIVIISHSYYLTGHLEETPLKKLNGNGPISNLAVYGFFVISGFLVYQSLLRSKNIKDYLWKRCLRIVPALLVVVFVSTFVFGLVFTTLDVSDYLTNTQTFSYWLRNSALIPGEPSLPGLFEAYAPSISVNGSLWTLRYEFLFYFLLISVLWIPTKYRLKSLLALTFLSLVFMGFGSWLEKEWGFLKALRNLPILGYYFLMGMVFSLINPYLLKFKYLVFGLALGLFLFGFFFLGDQSLLIHLSLPFWIICFGQMYFPALDYSRYTGDISYGTYIYAFPIQQILVNNFGVHDPVLLITLSLPIVCFFGWLSWQLVERQFLRRKKSF